MEGIENRQRAVRVEIRALLGFTNRVKLDLGLGQESVAICLINDREMARLNETYRNKKGTTDVLSFPAAGMALPGIAGDIAISVPAARRQALEQGHSLADEVKVLILHGLLHLAGYDHQVDNGRMERRERLLRRRLGLPQGLIERSTSAPCPILAPAVGRKGGKPQSFILTAQRRSRRP